MDLTFDHGAAIRDWLFAASVFFGSRPSIFLRRVGAECPLLKCSQVCRQLLRPRIDWEFTPCSLPGPIETLP